MSFLRYLKEFDEEPEDSIEEDPGYYDFDQPDDPDKLVVEPPIDLSDEVESSDKYIYSNSELMSYYGKGSGLDIADNDELYEIVKIVHELTDRHIYLRDLTWKTNIRHRFVDFIFKIGDGTDDYDQFFLDGVCSFLENNIIRQFGPFYKFDKEHFKDDKGKHAVKITVNKIKRG